MFLIFYILFLLAPTPVSADTEHIVISEIQTYGQTKDDEFIRLYNPTGAAADISGWKLTKKTSSGTESNLVAKFADGISVTPNSYFLIAPQSGYLGTAAPDARYSGTSFYIADDSTIILKDASGNVIDKVGFGEATDFEGAAAPNPEKGASIKRNNFNDTDNNKNDFSGPEPAPAKTPPPPEEPKIVTQEPLPSAPATSSAKITSPEPDYSQLQIIEILPNPAGSDTESEYIKIKNNDDEDIILTALFLDDDEGGSNPYKIPADTVIKAGEILTFYRSKTKIALNNDTDAARLLDKNKKELQRAEYDEAPEGAAYIMKDGEWSWANAEKEAEKTNASSSPAAVSPKTSASLKSATDLVIAAPNIFGSQIMYIDGLQLYMYSHDWPELEMGDKISVYGTPSTYYNEPRLKLKNKSSIQIISRGNNLEPAPADSVSEDDLGRLIIIEGEVLQTASTKIIIDVNGEEVPVCDKTKQKLFSRLKEKDQVQITGVVSQYKDEFRLLPRGADDIKILQSAATAIDKKPAAWQYLASTLALGSLAGGVIYIRRKKNAPAKKLG